MKKNQYIKPDLLIIGAMKCATSTLHDQLGMHHSFFMTTPKEPFFFSDDQIFTKGYSWYSDLFKEAKPHQLKGESSTHYSKLPNYPLSVKRISDYCPNAKFIYIMRHPVERLISHYLHEYTLGNFSCDIDLAVSKYKELIDYGKYSMQIQPYIERFESKNILPIFTERLRTNPQNELETIFNFLGVEEKPVWRENIRSNVSSERLRASKWRDTLLDIRLLQFLRRTFIPKTIRTKIRNIWTIKERPELSAGTLRSIKSLFDSDLKTLGNWLGLSLDCDNFQHEIITQDSISWKI